MGERGHRPVGVSSSALPGWAPNQICAAAATAGLDGVEWGVGHQQVLELSDLRGGFADLRRAATSVGLLCASLSAQDSNALLYPIETWKWLIGAATNIGAPNVRVFALPAVHPQINVEWGKLQEQLSVCSALTAEAGVKLLIEPAPTTLVPGPVLGCQSLDHLVQDNVGIVYDPGSLAREGWVDPRLAVSLLGPLLRHVHVKNLEPRHELGTWRWFPATLSAGIVDWKDVLQALDTVEYRDWFVLDHLSGATSLQVLLGDVALLRRLLGRDGSC